MFCFCFTFEDGSHFTAQTDFQLVLFLIQSPIGFYYAWLNLNFFKNRRLEAECSVMETFDRANGV